MQILMKKLVDLHEYANNPRNNNDAISAVAASIENFGFKIPIVIDAGGEIICGHTRYRAAQKLGLAEVPCIIAEDLTPEQIKAFRLADNKVAELARWDIGALAVEIEELQAAGVDNLESFGFDTSENWWRQAAWRRVEKFCNLKLRPKINLHGDFRTCSFFETNRRGDGTNIVKIKEDSANVSIFAGCFVDFLNKTFGENLAQADWAIVTAPRRRHKDFHFATEICRAVSKSLNLPFFEDAFSAKNRNRILPEISLEKNPSQRNILIIDDVITTAETARACRQLLLDAGHTVFCIAAVRNNN